MISNEIVFEVRIQPRCAREGFEIMTDGHVRARVNAPPVDNAANNRLVALLAKEFGVAKSKIELLAGHKHRVKRLRVLGAQRRPDWLLREN